MTNTNKGFALTNLNNKDKNLPLSARIELIEKVLPPLKKGQVAIKVLASPINPSDLVYLMGEYGIPPIEGNYAGFEGCGLVEDANAGIYGRYLKGKRVAFFSTPGKDGCWAKKVITRADYCLPLRNDISDVQGATLIVNPLTSICMVERAISLGASGVIINAAASQVGKGVINYCNQKNLNVIATVRSHRNVEVLEKMGATAVLCTTDDDFFTQLKSAAAKLNTTVLFDAVASEDTALIMKALPDGSKVIVYGRLTDTHHKYGGEYSVADLIFRKQSIEGFWLSNAIQKLNPLQVLMLSKKVQKLFADGIFETDIQGEYDFETFKRGLEHYAVNKSDGKVILKPY